MKNIVSITAEIIILTLLAACGQGYNTVDMTNAGLGAGQGVFLFNPLED